MNLKEKIALLETNLNSISTHDDASPHEVGKALDEVIKLVLKHKKKTMKRRLGSFQVRLQRYFLNIYKALLGKKDK